MLAKTIHRGAPFLDPASRPVYPSYWQLPREGEKTMIKTVVVAAAIIGTALALGACRREVPAEPMKLGADVPKVEVVR
jgi:hypothetical protein